MAQGDEEDFEAKLLSIHKRVAWIADEEARGVWIRNSAARGSLTAEKLRLFDETDRVLDQLQCG